MEISLEEKRNNIQKIANIVDFGLGITQTVGNMEQLPTQKKQDICLFRFDTPNSPVFAYRLIKNASKLREYSLSLRYQPEDIGYPTIIYLDAISGEVVTEWITGEKLAYFDRPKEMQPTAGLDDLRDILCSLTKLHKHTSRSFSDVELVPRTHHLDCDEQELLPAESYYQRVLDSYVLMFEYVEQARNRDFISLGDYQFIKDSSDYVLNILETSKGLFESLGNFSLLHGDVHAENIIKTQSGIRLIDFENLHFGDRAVEIAYFLEHCSQAGFINQDSVAPLIDQYLELISQYCPDVVDRNFSDRLLVLRAYLTTKLLGMLSNGYTGKDQSNVNKTLYEDVLARTRIILASL